MSENVPTSDRIPVREGVYVAPTDETRADLAKLGLDRAAQDRFYSSLAQAAEKMLDAEERRARDLEAAEERFRSGSPGPLPLAAY